MKIKKIVAVMLILCMIIPAVNINIEGINLRTVGI